MEFRALMQIARPPDGFKITERPAVAAMIVASCDERPRLAHPWEAIKSRLKFIGHREGVGVPLPNRPGYLLFVDDGDRSAGLPRVKALFCRGGYAHYRVW